MKLCQKFSFMVTVLPAKYDCNNTRVSKDISIYVIFGHFSVLVFKMYHCRKKNWTHIKFCSSIIKLSKNIQHLLLTKNSHEITFHYSWDHTNRDLS